MNAAYHLITVSRQVDMATDFTINDKVFVPASRIPGMEGHPSAFYETRIAEVGIRKVKVHLQGGTTSEWIGTGLCQKNVGILIFTFGDLETEIGLLDPLAKSVLQYCRLLVPDDYLRAYKIRSVAELEIIWHREQAAYSHVVIIGHGSREGIKFSVDKWVKSDILDATLKVRGAPKKVFISLSCQTGYKTAGGKLSEMAICSHFIAPFHSVHGAVASQFAQTFLAFHLLEGESVGVAFKHARKYTPGSTSFRLWENGNLKAGQK
ncbi:hypothetical protein [Aeromonas sp. R7-5]|uniref:hypothetical protein n=1 Tax=Aeromonas sp. R7-5 TaxID=3138477 RepID=UPI0034A40467